MKAEPGRLAGVRVHHVGPGGGGVKQYAAGVDDVYRLLGATAVGPGAEADLVHVELAMGDPETWAAVRSVVAGPRPYLVTVHDPGEPVRHPRPLSGRVTRMGVLGAVAQRLDDLTAGRAEVARLLEQAAGHLATVGPAEGRMSWWLPHPRMTPLDAPRWMFDRSGPVRFGHVGYWGPLKGLGTLASAWGRAHSSIPDARLIVGGGSGSPNPYDTRMRRRLAGLPSIDVPGQLPDADLDDFLVELRAIVLPYRRKWPGGASGVAQRAAELGVPIIASDLPQLRAQLGDDGAIWVRPGSSAGFSAALSRAGHQHKHLLPVAAAAHARVLADGERLPGLLADAVEGVLSRMPRPAATLS